MEGTITREEIYELRKLLREELENLALDIRASVSANDQVPSFLQQKLKAGSDIALVLENSGGNEQLRIDSTGGGGGGIETTTDVMDINVDWATGYDGPDPGETIFHNQAEVDAYLASKSATAFKYPTKVWDNAIPTIVNHRVRFFPALGVHRPENPLPWDANGAWDFARKSIPKIFGDQGYLTIYQNNSGTDYWSTWESLHGDLAVVSTVATTPDGGITPPSITVSGTPFGTDDLIGYFAITDNQKNGIKPIIGNTNNTIYLGNQATGSPTTVRIMSPGIIFRNSYDDVNQVHTGRVFCFDYGWIPGVAPYIVNFDSIRIDQMGRATGIRIDSTRLEMWGCLFDQARQKDDFGADSFGLAIDEQMAVNGMGCIGGQLWTCNIRGPKYATVPGSSYSSWGPVNFKGSRSKDRACRLTLLWGVWGGFQTFRMEHENGSIYFNSHRFTDWNTGGSALFSLERMVVQFPTSQTITSGFMRVNYTGIRFEDCDIECDTNPYNNLMFEGEVSGSYYMFIFHRDTKTHGYLRLRQGLTANAGKAIFIGGPRVDVMFDKASDLVGASGDIDVTGREYYQGPPLTRSWTWAQLDDVRMVRAQPAGNLLGAVEVEHVEPGTTIGTGASLKYTNSGTTLEYQAPSDSGYGSPVNVGGGGLFTLLSANGKAVRVRVEPTALPGSDDTQAFDINRGPVIYPQLDIRLGRQQ